MKVLSINGSPHPQGCTVRALEEAEKILKEQGVEIIRVDVANKDVRGCIGCMYCREHGKCVFNDIVNETAPKLNECDGVLVGTPVYYAHSNGQLLAFLDRLFYSTWSVVDKRMKVGAAVISSRRAGSTSAMEEINKYFSISSMPIVPSTYWNEVHGFTQEHVEKDLEGLQTMRNLGRNMAFLMRAIKAQAKVEGLPEQEREHYTPFFGLD